MKDVMKDAANQNQNRLEDDNLSVLVDGELSDEAARALLKRLTGEQRARYREYCAIGDALRGLDGDIPELTSRVMSALEDEPTVFAPMPKTADRRPALWLAAATVAAITWGLWSAGPRDEAPAPLAANQPANVLPYLAAHQDFAQAVVSPSEMRFTRVTLAGAGR